MSLRFLFKCFLARAGRHSRATVHLSHRGAFSTEVHGIYRNTYVCIDFSVSYYLATIYRHVITPCIYYNRYDTLN